MNKYITVTHPGVNPDVFARILTENNIELLTNYDLTNHFLVNLDEAQLEIVRNLQEVRSVDLASAPLNVNPIPSMTTYGTGDNWGLFRIDQRIWDRNKPDVPYSTARTGSNVDVYVVDTGCRVTHNDLVGRATVVFDPFSYPSYQDYGTDRVGHGTHVASTIAGTRYGVAKDARLFIAKVFDAAGGSLETVINGINACVCHHFNKLANGINRPSVMNLSLGGGAHPAQEAAVMAAINAGIVVVAAAGNDGKDLGATGYDIMPAEIAKAITVGATNLHDWQAPFSNYGSALDVFAPGQDIVAASHIHDQGTLILSGTSMACPHVAGVVALYLDDKPIMRSAEEVMQVHDWIVRNATPDVVALTEHAKRVQTPNRMLFAEFISNKQ